MDTKYSDFKMRSLDDYEQLKKKIAVRRNTQSQYVRKNLMDNVREHSNGESAFLYFTDKIRENGFYLLAGNQPLPGKTAGFAKIPGRFRPLFRMPVPYCHPFAVPAFHEGGKNIRYGRGNGGCKAVDGACKCAGIF